MNEIKLDGDFWQRPDVRGCKESIAVWLRCASFSYCSGMPGYIDVEDLEFACYGIDLVDDHVEVLVREGLFSYTDNDYDLIRILSVSVQDPNDSERPDRPEDRTGMVIK